MRRPWLITLLLGVGCLVAGCGAGLATREDKYLGSYLQNQVGYRYHFRGTGSRFASMDWEVLFKKGNKVQIVETGRGVRAAMVFRTGRDAIELVYFGEKSPYGNHLRNRGNLHQVWLHTPLEVGTRWEDRQAVYEIIAVDEKLALPVGQRRALKVKKTYKELDATEYMYFVRGLGFVKSEYVSGEVRVTTELETIRLSGKT